MVCLSILVTCTMINAQQTIVWQDDFSGDKGWQTFEYKKKGLSQYTKDEKLLMKSEDDCFFASTCKTNLNAGRNFIISVDAESKSGLKEDSYFGIIFNYLDSKNFMRFTIEKGFAYFDEVREGSTVRHDYDIIKHSKSKVFNLQVKKTGNSVMFIVNDEEILDIERVDVITGKIGLYVEGKTEVAFDNIKIMQ